MVRPGNYYQNIHHHHPKSNDHGFMIVAAIFGFGFIFSVLALILALVALCR